MRTLRILFFKELKSLFSSPIAYIVIALVMLINGISFKSAMTILEAAPSEGSLIKWSFNSDWFWLSYFFIFPLITMRLFAEENKMGTLETLLTAPVRSLHIVLAKFFAALFFYAIIWIPSFINFLLFQWITDYSADLPLGELLGSYLILILLGLFNLAIGCFASALTQNQIIAAILSFSLSLVHFLLGYFILIFSHDIPEALIPFTQYITTKTHIDTFTSGLLDTRPIIYYTTLSILFLYLTHQTLNYRRWKR